MKHVEREIMIMFIDSVSLPSLAHLNLTPQKGSFPRIEPVTPCTPIPCPPIPSHVLLLGQRLHSNIGSGLMLYLDAFPTVVFLFYLLRPRIMETQLYWHPTAHKINLLQFWVYDISTFSLNGILKIQNYKFLTVCQFQICILLFTSIYIMTGNKSTNNQ